MIRADQRPELSSAFTLVMLKQRSQLVTPATVDDEGNDRQNCKQTRPWKVW